VASSIPGAVSNFYNLLTAAFASNSAVSVEYNPIHKYKFPPNTSRINILGWTGDQEPAELGPSYRREETFQIHVEIAAHTGEQSVDAQMSLQTTVMDNFETISTLVANNWTLPSTSGGNDGTVRFAEVGTFTYNPLLQPRGSLGVLTFAVHCSQRVTSLT
jgi:hypothetical protein